MYFSGLSLFLSLSLSLFLFISFISSLYTSHLTFHDLTILIILLINNYVCVCVCFFYI